jgi:hypothetical protein
MTNVAEEITIDKNTLSNNEFREDLTYVLKEIEGMLISKNLKYGNSALEPKRIFSKATAVEQILVRLDDKISRLANQQNNDDEDVILDLIGYLIILRIAQRRDKGN